MHNYPFHKPCIPVPIGRLVKEKASESFPRHSSPSARLTDFGFKSTPLEPHMWGESEVLDAASEILLFNLFPQLMMFW